MVMNSEFDLLSRYLNNSLQEVSWMYEIDSIESQRGGQWNYRSRVMLSLPFREAIKWRAERNLVNNILVIGETGSGKTNVSLRVARFIANVHNIDISRIYVRIGSHLDLRVKRVLREYGKDAVIIVEEAEETINRMRSMSNRNLSLSNTLDQVRKYNIHFLFVAPHLIKLDKSVVNDAINWLFTCTANNHKRRFVEAICEYNAKDKRLTYQEYVLHSIIKFAWVDYQAFKRYERVIKEYHNDVERSFAEEAKSWDNSIEQDIENKKAADLMTLVDQCVVELKKNKKTIENKDAKTLEIKRKYAVQMFQKGASISEVSALLRVGFAFARGAKVQADAMNKKKEESSRT